MKFELTILGCGGAIPTLERNPSSQYLNIQDRHFLIDCGEGSQIQLRKYKCKFSKIDHIFISHLHGDHFLGLFGSQKKSFVTKIMNSMGTNFTTSINI
ncbi:MBL fold metallo-hydrolase [bacterium]|nr:MBL fold metallo-hydrolase [bacterium]